MDRNVNARIVRSVLRDYKIEYNGMLDYHILSLLDDMTQHKVILFGKYQCRLVPPKKEITNEFLDQMMKWQDFVQRGKEREVRKGSIWALDQEAHSLQWIKQFTWHQKILLCKIIILPEFLNRFGFVSSFSYGINQIQRKYKLSKNQKFQLVYVAPHQTSQIQFYFIVGVILKRSKYNSKTNFYHLYRRLCKQYELIWTGGPFPRYQPQPEKDISNDQLKESIDQIKQALIDMDKGEFLNKKKQRITKTVDKYKILGVGPVAGLSFAPICVFTGLSTSCNGIITASLSRVNLSKKMGAPKIPIMTV